MKKPLVSSVVAYVWTCLVVIGSSIPGGSTPSISAFDVPHFDKLVHFIMYFGIVFLWSAKNDQVGKNDLVKIFLGSICLGILMEVLQNSVFVDRSFEFLDIIANIMGSIMGLIIFYKFFKKPKIC